MDTFATFSEPESDAPPSDASSSLLYRDHPLYQKITRQLERLDRSGLALPFFMPHEGVNNGTTRIQGRELINFSSYNYLGLSGHPGISAAAKEAIDRYGTSVSASRAVSGEIPLHRELEERLAAFIGVDDCMLYVGGHATNVSTIGHLMGEKDLILHDEHVHNSALEGCRLSGARRKAFRHNDTGHLERLLDKHAGRCRRVLILVEGVYSMEGDVVPLADMIHLKQRYGAWLMVDEAHSIGVLGMRGRGVAEHCKVNPRDVDIWMGTLSKAMASCGGYIAGDAALIRYLKQTSPGFVYSVGMPPPNAAAALAALGLIEDEPHRLGVLRERSQLFLTCAREHGLDTGRSAQTPIVPVITRDSALALRMAAALFRQGIHVSPIFYPAVKKKAARLRFFVAAEHTEEQIRYAVDCTAKVYFHLMNEESEPCTS